MQSMPHGPLLLEGLPESILGNSQKACRTGGALREYLASDPEQAAFNTLLSKWINHWRESLCSWSIWALNMVNHPSIDPYLLYGLKDASMAGLFRMTQGKVMPRTEVLQYFIDAKTDPKSVEDWKDDHRGNDTVQIIIFAGNMPRLIWFSIRDAAKRRKERDAENLKMSNMLAKGWEGALAAVIESGDASRTGDYLRMTAMKALPKPK